LTVNGLGIGNLQEVRWAKVQAARSIAACDVVRPGNRYCVQLVQPVAGALPQSTGRNAAVEGVESNNGVGVGPEQPVGRADELTASLLAADICVRAGNQHGIGDADPSIWARVQAASPGAADVGAGANEAGCGGIWEVLCWASEDVAEGFAACDAVLPKDLLSVHLHAVASGALIQAACWFAALLPVLAIGPAGVGNQQVILRAQEAAADPVAARGHVLAQDPVRIPLEDEVAWAGEHSAGRLAADLHGQSAVDCSI